MVRKILVCSAVSLLLLSGGIATSVLASDAGPAEIVLAEGGKKPATFPHKAHQDKFECGECHHGMADGKQVPYAEGMEIQKCETCHNKDVLAGKTAGKEKLDTLKGAGHANCLECHKKSDNKELKKCGTCHKKS